MAEFAEILVITVILVGTFSPIMSDAINHKYQKGDSVPLYANKIGPFHNPSETYPYYNLPFCTPDYPKEKGESLGEVLNGDHLVTAPYKLDFLVNKSSEVVCRKNLTKDEVSQFQTAVAQDYYLQMYYDDLPIWAFTGKTERDGESSPDEYRYFIYTHLHFDIFYNGNNVIEISVRSADTGLTELAADKVVDVEFLHSVKWKEIDSPFEKRMDKYTASAQLPRHLEIHQLSIMNSFWTILILIGFLLALYVRVLRKDFYKFGNDVELADDQEETGWKILHGDVFRYPNYKALFAAAMGCGTQLLAVVVSILILGLFGFFRPYDRGVIQIALIITYALTCGLGGFTAGSFYHQLEGNEWVRNLCLTGCLFCGPLFLAFCFLNTVASIYGTTVKLPLGTVVMIFVMLLFLGLPLLLLGGSYGRRIISKFEAPCRTTKCVREIPRQRWYRGILPQMALAGFLPFGAIYIELYYILASIWGHRIYTLYGMLCIAFSLLVITTALVSIGLTYFQLAAEDHRWWWRSFLCGGSTGLYLFAYSFFYYFQRSDMKGLMQTSFFFGYMTCFSYALFLLLGTVGFRASLLFVRYIYSNIKCD